MSATQQSDSFSGTDATGDAAADAVGSDASGESSSEAKAAWHTRNDDYLAAALAVLRERLEAAARPATTIATAGGADADDRHLTPVTPIATSPAPAAVNQGARIEHRMASFFRRAPSGPAIASTTTPRLGVTPPPPGPVPGATPAPAIELPAGESARRLAAASAGEPPPALLMLARRLGLSDFERDVLLMCVALELDTSVAARCAAAQGDPGRDYPTFALAMALLDAPAWEALSPQRPLRHWRLIEISQPATRALTSSALRADERIVNFVKGLNDLDDRLSALLAPIEAAEPPLLPPSQRAAVDELHGLLASPAAANRQQVVVALRGEDRSSKREVGCSLAATLGLRLCRLPASTLPAHPAELDLLARLWHRESLLLPVALYVDAYELERGDGPDGLTQRVSRFVARTGGLLIVDSRDDLDLPVDLLGAADIAKPTSAEQRAAWVAAIGPLGTTLAPRLATQFDLSRANIAAIAQSVPGLAAATDEKATADALWRACRERARPSLARLAERLQALATWNELVLPEAETALLRQIEAQVQSRAEVYDEGGFRARMNRGLGVSALFAGDSGTGKTMAAEVLANALRLDLYRIDLSAVVSKYIGETEKNLRQVFDAAESGGAILLFDEADALFGKRSEVKDSHDRYANIEIDYLLQRMEAFGGLAILATNMKSALDAAFVRRLRFIVNFPYPGLAERRRMWERAFPIETKVGVVDWDRLASLSLTGGNIQSTALTAAFMAANQGTPVTMTLLMDAARMEYRKLDRPVNEADFRLARVAGGRP